MWYRRPFFKRLGEIYNVKFVFTHIEVSKDVYGVELSNEIEGLGGVNYRVLKNYRGVAFGVIKELLKADCDVIIDSLGSIESLFSFAIARLRRRPIVFWSEAWGWRRRKSWRGELASSLINFIASHSDAMLVPGTKHKEYFISLGVSPDKVFIMPNVSNLIIREENYAEKERLREELSIGSKKVVLCVGRLVKRKGIEYLIEAFSKLRKERNNLIIIGKGECREELELLANSIDRTALLNHKEINGYIYLRYHNVVERKLVSRDKESLSFTSHNLAEYHDVFVGKNRLYDNRGAEIYK